jgi:WD40 repeat protein
MATGSTFGETAWAACESVIRRFEDAWHDRERPDIGDYLAGAPLDTVRLLVELVHIDLEFRLRAGEGVRAEDYFSRFPELTEPEHALDLIAAEFGLRNRHAGGAWAEEFFLRFPEHLDALRDRLPAGGSADGLSVTRPVEREGVPLIGIPAIPGYEIEGELGRGGMGVVYKARDVLLHRAVAIKTFAAVPKADGCARFAREAEAIARLDHPHIVPVYEVGEWRAADGAVVPYFAMKLYPGGSLDAAPAGPGTDARGHAKAVETIARAVHHAHTRGVLHRDLKPSNILLDDEGRPHVADFGLAGRLDPDAAQTAVIAGTPAYMAPEQARAPGQVSTAADVYGLGAILYNRLTGAAPFAAETPLAVLDLVSRAPAGRPSAVNPAVPRDLDTICLKCLEKDPARRYASAAELADDLERFRKGLPIAARPARAWEVAYRRARRHPLVAALIATTAAALVGAVAVLADSRDRIRQKEEETRAAYLRECAMRYRLEEVLRVEQATRAELEATVAREQRALYLERVSSAGRLYAANRLREAWELLDACPAAHRGWEWRYLDARRRTPRTELAGYAPPVTAVAALADGRLVSADGVAVRVWNAAGRVECQWPVGSSRVATLAAHPTRNWVAVADFTSVCVWDADTGRRLAQLTGAEWAGFTPDGNRLATADGQAVKMWSVPDGGNPTEWKPEGGLFGNYGRVRTACFTTDGNALFTATDGGAIRKWAVVRGVDLATRTASAPVSGLATAAGGKLLVEAHPGYVLLTDPATGQMRARLDHPTDDRPAIAVSADGREVAAGGANGEVVVWEVGTQRKRVYRGHPGRVASLTFLPNRRLVSCGEVLRVWDLNEEPDVRTLAWVGAGEGGMAVSPDGALVAVGPRLAAAGGVSPTVVYDAGGSERHRLDTGPGVAFDPRSGRLTAVRPGGGAAAWDLVTGRPVWSTPLPGAAGEAPASPRDGQAMAVSRDGAFVATWSKAAKAIHLWNATDGTPVGELPAGGYVFGLAFSPDGGRLLAATTEGVAAWEIATRARVAWGAGRVRATAVCFSPAGQFVATLEDDGALHLHDAATGREVRRMVGSGVRASAVCFSPDGTRLATGGADRAVRVWDVETGRELLALTGATSDVTAIAWDGTSDRIFALDHALRVWEAGAPSK